ncbi:MAG: RHS repeat-associated core domain-containing protein [Anaerolineae bacterium]|uniref:RHS repeat domain-containing protein n=1 Tax=Candidatus Amarolinea dominans TaxID=3140696 RepID=UPI0031375B16|nr:RHS repeat-associated core domain-containing protein [Anaerolineae bacterium]
MQKYWYDANGNATRRINGSQDITLTYDAENRLTGMSGGVTSSYVYDADGNRVKETIAGVTRVFVGNYYELDNGTVKKYYYAGATRVAESSGGVLYYLLTDHLGSTALTLDSSGVRVTELRYYPFGAARYNAGNQVTTYRFTGQRWDSGTALYFYQSRWYDPLIGRFLAADTIVPQPENPQNLNRYSYVGNQPLGFIDPSGHAAICGTSADDGCGGIDALQSIEMQLRQGRLDPIGAKQAYYQYYLAHPGENAGAYQPLNPTEEFNGIISTGYAQAQAELGAANLGGLALGAATTNGVIFEAMSGYGGNAAHGIGLLAAGGALGKLPRLKLVPSDAQDPASKNQSGPSGSITADDQIAGQPRGVSFGNSAQTRLLTKTRRGRIPSNRSYRYSAYRSTQFNHNVPPVRRAWNQFKNVLGAFMRQVMFGR